MTRILFSPVGTADPITALGDGPMLHIVRHKKPEVIVLFLSPKMTEFHESDQRYTRAIRLLSDSLGNYVPDIRLLESDTADVYRYDVYIHEFREHLQRLGNEFQEAELLLNVTSGTAGMQHALVAIDVFGSLPSIAIQVPTPSRTISSRGDREDPGTYDLDLLWSLNPDNEAGAANRCIEVESPQFASLLQRDNLKRLIASYDYAGAVRLTSDAALPPSVERVLKGVAMRIQQDHQLASRLLAGSLFEYDQTRVLREYVLALEVLLEREQWAEFVRAATPAITETFRQVLQPHLSEDKYSYRSGWKWLWDESKIDRDSGIRRALGSTRPNFVNNEGLVRLIRQYVPDHSCVAAMKRARTFEEGIRNFAAHEIGKVDKNDIQRYGKAYPEELVKILAGSSGARLGTYRRINKQLAELIDGAAIHQ